MSGSNTSRVLYQVENAVAEITLNRPENINVFDVYMRDDMFRVVKLFRDDPDARIGVINGCGEKGFCAGADLKEFGTTPSQLASRSIRWERDIWGLLYSIEKPIIASMHGYVIGTGIEIAALCDIRISSHDAIFRMPEVTLGMIPAAGGTQTISRAIGMAPTLDMIMTGRKITAQDALQMRLVDRVVPREDLYTVTKSLALDLAGMDIIVLMSIKMAAKMGLDHSLQQGLELEMRVANKLSQATGSQ